MNSLLIRVAASVRYSCFTNVNSQSHVALWLSGSELMILYSTRLTDMYDDVPEMSSFSVLSPYICAFNPLLALKVNNAKGWSFSWIAYVHTEYSTP